MRKKSNNYKIDKTPDLWKAGKKWEVYRNFYDGPMPRNGNSNGNKKNRIRILFLLHQHICNSVKSFTERLQKVLGPIPRETPPTEKIVKDNHIEHLIAMALIKQEEYETENYQLTKLGREVANWASFHGWFDKKEILLGLKG